MSDFVVENGVLKVTNPELFQTWQDRPDYLEALAASSDPELQKKKQVVVDLNAALFRAVMADRVEEEIDGILEEFMVEDYIQHDPNLENGRAPLAKWFRKGALGIKSGAPVAVIVEGDLATLIVQIPLPDPEDPDSTYDMYFLTAYRVREGKLAEHWAPWKKTAPGESPM